MSAQFKIDLLNIRTCSKNKIDVSDDTVGYALETLFPSGENVIISWNSYNIPLSIKYDISDIWNDTLLMIDALENGNKSKFTIHWPSSGFFAVWDFTIHNECVEIKAYWTEIKLDKKDLLSLRGDKEPMIINKKDFLEEWYNLITAIKEVIIESGYDINKLKNFKKSLVNY